MKARERFEEWAVGIGLNTSLFHEGVLGPTYIDHEVQLMWGGWGNCVRSVVSDIVEKMQKRIAELRKMYRAEQRDEDLSAYEDQAVELERQIAELSKEYGLEK